MEETNNIFTGKTALEAIEEGLKTLGITLDEAETEVLEEGKKKLFGSVKARVRVTKKCSDGARAAQFIDGLLKILGIQARSEIVTEEENIKIEIRTAQSAKVIGKRGDVLDAIQCMAGAVANIGREEYKKVIVDCENYRQQREQTLVALAHKLAKKAVETGRKMILEPMSPYERRIIHAALVDNADVKTVSEGREPARYIVVIPSNAKPGDKGVRFGERNGDRRVGHRDRRERGRGDGERRFSREGDRRGRGGSRGDRGDRGPRPAGGAKRGKKEIIFGTFLGNSQKGAEDAPAEEPEKTEE